MPIDQGPNRVLHNHGDSKQYICFSYITFIIFLLLLDPICLVMYNFPHI